MSQLSVNLFPSKIIQVCFVDYCLIRKIKAVGFAKRLKKIILKMHKPVSADHLWLNC